MSELNQKPLGFKNYGPNWTWIVDLDLANVQSDSIAVKITAHWNDLQFSDAIQNFIAAMPDWATFVGRGSGLIVVEQKFDIDVNICRK